MSAVPTLPPLPPTAAPPCRPHAAGLRAAWRRRGLPWLVGLLALLLWLGARPALASVVTVTQAQSVATAPGAPPDWRQALPVALPDDWAHSWPGHSGERWYRLRLPGLADGAVGPSLLYGLYLERACSVAEVRVNGQLVHQGGRFEPPVSRHCHRPQLAAVPAALLRSQDNVVEIRVRGHALREVASREDAGGLSALEFGPHAVLAEHHARRSAWAVRLPDVLSGTLLLMGSFMFMMGWFNRAQSYLAYFGALMVGWAVHLARWWTLDLPISHHHAEAAMALMPGLLTWAAVQFLLRYASERLRWLDRALPAQTVAMAASLLLAPTEHLHTVATAWHVLLGAELVVAALHHLGNERRQASRQFWPMLCLMLLVAGALGLGALTVLWPLDARVGLVAQLVPALVFILLGMRLVQQFGRAFLTSEQNRAELEVRIREATAQIERNFTQLAELKVEQVTDRERKRIAADLHDDLGAKLLTIVHTSDNERISSLAREALEEMRLSVRGLTGKPVKLAAALGDWRAEVVSRLGQSGVQGEWRAPGDEDMPMTLSSRAYVQTTRILREAVSNIIKHSGASHCTITCGIEDGDFQCVIQDNGRGITMDTDGRLDKGHGMASMKGRAKQLQGQCLVESSPGYGTVIRLTLPLEPLLTSG